MRLQKIPVLAAAILGGLSICSPTFAHGGGFRGGGGAQFGGGGARFGGTRVFAGPRGVAVRSPGGFAVVRPGFTAVGGRGFVGSRGFVGRQAFVGERFNRGFRGFDNRRRFNNAVFVGGGYPYFYNAPYPYAYNPGYTNPYPVDPYVTSGSPANYNYPGTLEPVAAYTPQQCPTPVAGDVVSNVQRVLKSRGYYRGPIDGLSGPSTRAAIRWYNASMGMPATGVIDAALLTSMRLM